MTTIPGLTYEQNKVSEEFQKAFTEYASKIEWEKTLRRDTKQYGYDYNYLKPGPMAKIEEIPVFFEYLYQYFKYDKKPEQCIINKYEPGQGINAHTDHTGLFSDRIVIFSFESSIVMKFKEINGTGVLEQKLEPGSMLIMEGRARYNWTHEIPSRKSDDGKPRSTRISVTFRWKK